MKKLIEKILKKLKENVLIRALVILAIVILLNLIVKIFI